MTQHEELKAIVNARNEPLGPHVWPDYIREHVLSLLDQLEEARGLMRKWVQMADNPEVQKCGLASSMIFGLQRACRAFLSRGKE